MLPVKSLVSPLLFLGVGAVLGCTTHPRPSAPDTAAAKEPVVTPATKQSPPIDDATSSSAATASNSAPPASAHPAAATPSLPLGTTVLHVGDSFAGALGLDLNREFKAAGVRSILKYQTSSYIPNWASGKEIELYLANYHPDLVLVTLGANELQIPDPQERVRTIRRLVNRIGQRPCVWIGPPLWPDARPALLEVIRRECAPCLYLDSTAHLPNLERARDGIHPSGPARTEWAAFVVHWLAEHRDPNGPQPWSLRGGE